MSSEFTSSALAFHSDVIKSLILSQQEEYSVRMQLILLQFWDFNVRMHPELGWCVIEKVIASLSWT